MDNINNKLTQAAQSALNASVREISDMILRKAYANASINKTNEEISLQDILKAKEEILNLKQNDYYYQNKRRRRALLAAMLGAAYALFGIIFYLYQNFVIDFSKSTGLIITFLGVTLILISLIMYQTTTLKNHKNVVFNELITNNTVEYELVKKWNIIELLTSDLMLKRGITSKKINSVQFIIEFLSNELEGTIKKEDIQKILIIRNNLVHRGSTVPKIELERTLSTIDKVIGELNNRIYN